MDRKGIIIVALMLLGLVAYPLYQQKQNADYQKLLAQWKLDHPKEAAALADASASPSASATASVANPAIASGTSPVGALAPEPTATKVEKTVLTPAVSYVFTNLGGGIANLALLKHEAEVAGQPVILNRFGTHPIGAVLQNPQDPANEAYNLTVTDSQVVLDRTNSTGLQINKTFTLPVESGSSKKITADEYVVQMDVAFTNHGTAAIEYPKYYVFAGSAEPIHPRDQERYTLFSYLRDGKSNFFDVTSFNARKMPLIGIETAPAQATHTENTGSFAWAGVRDQYFTTIITPETPGNGVWTMPLEAGTSTLKALEGAISMPGFTLNPGASTHQKFTIYAGPKEYRRLLQLGQDQQEIMEYGWDKAVSITLLRIMNWLHDRLGNYALAIIVLTFFVRGALWPIQGAATKSMKRMQTVQPEMTKLKEKYKDDPTRMNTEMMKLYKDHKINPLAGCIPMFIQIPIFFGFYGMLGTAVELRNSHFLWVHDLSQSDTIFHIAGMPINILPICMASTMLWQMSLSPKTGDAAQQKMFMFMPLIFVVFTYNFASALALYYTVQNILSIVQLYVTRNQMANESVVVSVPSKKPRR